MLQDPNPDTDEESAAPMLEGVCPKSLSSFGEEAERKAKALEGKGSVY